MPTAAKPKPKRGRAATPAKCKWCKTELPSVREAIRHQWGCPAKPATSKRGRPRKQTKCPHPKCGADLPSYRLMIEHERTCIWRPQPKPKARPIAARKSKPEQ